MVASTSEHGVYNNSSGSSYDRDISDLEINKLIPTTGKKKEEQSNSSITISILFNLNMVDVFEPLLEHILTVILKTTSPGGDTRKMLAANDLKEYDNYRRLDTIFVYQLRRDIAGIPTKLKNHKASIIVDTNKRNNFHNKNGDKEKAKDPTKWNTNDFDEWLDNGKSKSNSVIQQVVAVPPPSTMTMLTKEEVEDNTWNRGRQDITDYLALENDGYYIEWHKKVDQQSKLNG